MRHLEQTLTDIAARVGPAILGLGRGARGGSAVIAGPGQAITLARHLRAEEVTVHFGDGREALARLDGVDDALDIAVLSLDSAEVTPLTWGETPVALGTAVFALADPAGRGLRVTPGHVSCGPRRVRGPRGRMLDDVIEHTAPLPRGSGGGALVDADGRLLGLNAVRADGGLILAVPVTGLRERIADIAAGRPARALRLGVAVVPPRIGRRMRRAVGLPEHDGLLVRAVESGGPAETAGVARGDLIVAIGGAPASGVDDLYAALDAAEDGSTLELGVVRGVEELQVTVTPTSAEPVR